MAGFLGAGTLLFVLLLGTSYSIPVKKGGSQSTGPNTNTGGGVYGGPGSGQWSKAGQGSSPGMDYHYSDIPRVPTANFRPNAGGAPGYGGPYPGLALAGNKGPAANQDVAWLKSPPHPLSDMDGSQDDSGFVGGMGSGGSAGGGMDDGGAGAGGMRGGQGGAGPGGAGPDGPSQGPSQDAAQGPVGPMYQPGELSHMANTFEHGNYDSETETQGSPSTRPGGPVVMPMLPIPYPHGHGHMHGHMPWHEHPYHLSNHPGFYWYPYYDFMFLTGQYPPGTVSHFSSNFEQGKDYWHDARYNKYFYTVGDDSGQQKKTFPGGQFPGNPKKQMGQA